MKYLKHSFIYFFLIFAFNANAQFMFRRTYGFGTLNDGRCVIQTRDHGYAICGSTTLAGGGQTNFYLIKTDSTGAMIFHKPFGKLGIDLAFSLVEMADSGFIIAGYSNSFSANNDYDVYLVRTDNLGNSIWEKTLGTSDWDFAYDIKPTVDGNFILAGNSYGSSNGTSSGYVVKIDSLGNILWEKFIESDRAVSLKQVLIKNDGNFVVCGSISSTTSYPEDGFIAFLNSNGDSTKTEIIDGGMYEAINAIDTFSNGDLVLAGLTIDTATDDKDEMLGRLDSSGNLIWLHTFLVPGTEEFNDVFIAFNDTIISIGSTTSSGSGQSDFHIVKSSSAGWPARGNTYGGSENEFSYSGLLTNDKGLALVGSSKTYTPGQQSVFFVKSDSLFTYDPNVTINVRELPLQNTFDVFPNPSNGILNITSENSKGYNLVRLIGTDGKIIFESENHQFPFQINIGDVKPGIYILELINNNYCVRKKIIVSK